MINHNIKCKSIHVVLIIAICICGVVIAVGIQSKQGLDNAAISEEGNASGESITVLPPLSNDVIDIFPPTPASWAPIDGGTTAEGIVANSDIIVRGKVVLQEYELRGRNGETSLAFTISTIEISRVFAYDSTCSSLPNDIEKQKNQTVKILQTGGAISGVRTPPIEDAPILEFGSEYLLFLSEGDPGLYIPVGGRLGTAVILNESIGFVNEESANAFPELKYMNIEMLPGFLAGIEKEANKIKGSIIVLQGG